MTKNLPAQLTVNVPATVAHEPAKKRSKKHRKSISNPAVLLSMAMAALKKSFEALGIKQSTDFADIAHVEDLLALKNATVQDKAKAADALESASLILKSVERHTRILRRVNRSQAGIDRVEELLAQAVQTLSAGVAA